MEITALKSKQNLRFTAVISKISGIISTSKHATDQRNDDRSSIIAEQRAQILSIIFQLFINY